MSTLSHRCGFLAFVLGLCLPADSVPANPLSLPNILTANMSDLPRYTKLPLFDPHRETFTCVRQDGHVPPVDPQADLWFQQALALESPDIYAEDRDYAQIYRLYRQAADLNHWKAILNLASLILENHAGLPEQGNEAAIRWVEKAMQLGVPDAWDRMGIYHQNGIVKGGNATSAYAFFQKAADMGSPSAMTFLGDKLGGTYDSAEGDFWGNRPIAIEMLQCAMGQGYADAAYELGLYQSSGYSAKAKTQALKTFHEGVRLGSAKCANNLSVEFNGFNLTSGKNLIGYVDKARSERYSLIGDALEWYKGRLKLPNLDKVLPLPPAALPKWDGNKKSLIDAAKAVTPSLKPGAPSGASLQGREQIADGYGVTSLADSPYSVPGDQPVPETGYWLALFGAAHLPKEKLASARSGRPERYRAGERFEPSTISWLLPETVQWYYLGEPRPLPPSREMFLTQMVHAGWLRQVPALPSVQQCAGFQRCPRDGIWQGHIDDSHPQAVRYNTVMQQAYVREGDRFPDPRERALDIERDAVVWTWLGSPNGDSDAPGSQRIDL
jgi:TPR repeat protein